MRRTIPAKESRKRRRHTTPSDIRRVKARSLGFKSDLNRAYELRGITKTQFANEVNRLAQEECARLNQKGGSPFGAVHHDMPESMLAWYYQHGLTPSEALTEINENAGI